MTWTIPPRNEYGKVNTVPQQDAYYISTPAICISHIQWAAGDKNCMKFSKKEFLVELSCCSEYIWLSLQLQAKGLFAE